MQITQLITRIGRSDFKLIGRDRFLLFMFVFVVYIAVVLRLGLPWLNAYLIEHQVMPGELIPIRLADIYPMLIAYLVIYTSALLIGTVVGFVMLDEKDHHTLTAMLVTPVPLQQYALYRAGLPAILAFVIILAEFYFINLALLPLWQMVLLATGAALTAPIVSLFFAIVAENKVAGFAYAKFIGMTGWTALIGWFVPDPWQWLFGLWPPFLISKAYWMALAGQTGWWAALLIGVVLQIALINWLLRRFTQAAYRS